MHIFDNLKQYDKRYSYQNQSSAPIPVVAEEEKPTPAEIELRNKQLKAEQRKEKWNKVLNGIGVLSFFALLIGGTIALYNSDTLLYIVGGIVCVVVLGFLFLCAYFLFEDTKKKTYVNVIRAILIGIVIIAILLLIGSLMPDSFVNDAHRPDRF